MILEDISLRAESHYFDDLERCVLRSGDVLQLEVKVSGGKVEWFKDGVLVPKVGGKQAVERPYLSLLNLDKLTVGCGIVNGKRAEPVEKFPPN